jgi:hypothetical protein
MVPTGMENFRPGEGMILCVIPQLIVPIKAALNTQDYSIINSALMMSISNSIPVLAREHIVALKGSRLLCLRKGIAIYVNL